MGSRFVRLADWEPRLQTFIAARRTVPFAWGSNDCCLFAADAVLSMTGCDPAAAHRGSYADDAGAFGVLRALQGLRTAVTNSLAICQARPLQAGVGDVVLYSGLKGRGLGVAMGAFFLAPGRHGLVTFKLSHALTCWKLPYE